MQKAENKMLIKNGHVIDPVNKINGAFDILIENGKVSKVAKGIDKKELEAFDYHDEWKKTEEKLEAKKDSKKERMKQQAWNLNRVPMFAKREIAEMVDGKKEIRQDFIDAVHKYRKEIERDWPKEVKEFVFEKVFD